MNNKSNIVYLVAGSPNLCCCEKATVLSFCIVAPHTHTLLSRMLLRRLYVAGNNKIYSDLHVKWPIFLLNFNQIWTSWTDFHESPQYKILRESVQWEPHWYMMTDGRTDMTVVIAASRDHVNAPKIGTGGWPKLIPRFQIKHSDPSVVE